MVYASKAVIYKEIKKMEKIKVRKQAKKRIYVHNDLSNAAFHFKNQDRPV